MKIDQIRRELKAKHGVALVEKIGRGGSADVYKATKDGDLRCAIKISDPSIDASSKALVAAELRGLEHANRIRHSRIVTLFYVWPMRDCLVTCWELADQSLAPHPKDRPQDGALAWVERLASASENRPAADLQTPKPSPEAKPQDGTAAQVESRACNSPTHRRRKPTAAPAAMSSLPPVIGPPALVVNPADTGVKPPLSVNGESYTLARFGLHTVIRAAIGVALAVALLWLRPDLVYFSTSHLSPPPPAGVPSPHRNVAAPPPQEVATKEKPVAEAKPASTFDWRNFREGVGKAASGSQVAPPDREIREAVKDAEAALRGLTSEYRGGGVKGLLDNLPEDLNAKEIALLAGNTTTSIYRQEILELLVKRAKPGSLDPEDVFLVLGDATGSYRGGCIGVIGPYIRPPITGKQAAAILGSASGSCRIECLRPIAPLLRKPLSESEVQSILGRMSESYRSEALRILFGQARDKSDPFTQPATDTKKETAASAGGDGLKADPSSLSPKDHPGNDFPVLPAVDVQTLLALQAWIRRPLPTNDGSYFSADRKPTADVPTSLPTEKGLSPPPVRAGPGAASSHSKDKDGPSESQGTWTNTIGMRLVLIQPGEFMMGSPDSDADAQENEKPQHRVRITKPFYLGACHVTVGQFRKFVTDTGYKTDNEKSVSASIWRDIFKFTDEHPAGNVSWNDAVAFCKWLSDKEGNTYRLPTEAEWEYACRAGSTTRYCFGDDEKLLGEYAWFHLNSNSPPHTHPVGQRKPNAWGLYDMHGSVEEWCADWYEEHFYNASPKDDPTGPSSASAHVQRGGHYYLTAAEVRSAHREFNRPNFAVMPCCGFRVVRAP